MWPSSRRISGDAPLWVVGSGLDGAGRDGTLPCVAEFLPDQR
jgi:hypothetical protein